MVTAMLFAGGIGARMKYSDMPKQFLEVGGKPIIIHTMEHFARHPKVDAIVVACKADWIGYLNELIEAFNVPKVKAVVPGGANGFDSIHNGVMATAEFSKDPEDIILICDGVRPMLSEELITNCIKDTKSTKQPFLLLRVLIHFFTVRTEKPAARVTREVQCTLAQAPQGYTMERILWAHEEAYKRGITNPVSSSELFIELGEKVHLFLGERFNIKVTTPEDLTTLRSQFYYENYKQFAKEELKYGL